MGQGARTSGFGTDLQVDQLEGEQETVAQHKARLPRIGLGVIPR